MLKQGVNEIVTRAARGRTASMVSIIIPALNEEAVLGETLDHILSGRADFEILVVDARSVDRTAEVARQKGARVIEAPARQRAAQMNFGAAQARGEALLFLHADTWLPPVALEEIESALARFPAVAGGAFARRFRPRSLFLELTCALAELRNRAIGWHLGDQGIFARAEIFRKMGGFKPVDRFEDLDFSRRLAGFGKVVTLRPPVLSSNRRFLRRGPFRTTCRDFYLTCRYLAGREDIWSAR